MISLAERIRRWRESREGMSKADLARAVGVSRQAVDNWEAGKKRKKGGEPSHDHVAKIAAAIGVSVSVFWGEPPAPRDASTSGQKAS